MSCPYQTMPPLSDEEYEALKTSIREKGVLVPIEYDEDGDVLDGHHRLRACAELGIKEWPSVVREELSEEEKRAHSVRINIERRQLNRKQKRELIKEMLKAHPEKSNREIAKDVGAHSSTVDSIAAGFRQNGQTRRGAMTEKVVAYWLEHPDDTGATVAKALGCSPSLAHQVRAGLVKQQKLTPKTPPSSPDRAREREDRLRDMAMSGHTAQSIANALGHSVEYVRRLAREADIEIRADTVSRKQHRIDPMRVVSNTVSTLAGVASSIDILSADGLDSLPIDHVAPWVRSIEDSQKSIQRLLRELKARRS